MSRAALAALGRGVLALLLLVGVAHAGSAYYYCASMQAAMRAPCCDHSPPKMRTMKGRP